MANLNLNKVIIGGRITADPELTTTANGQNKVSFSIAINRRINDKDYTAYPNCTAWGKTAEFISRYFHKGSSICVVGRIDTRSYEKNGEKRYVTEVVVDEAHFVDSAGERTEEKPKIEPPGFEYDSDDLPF